MKKSIAILLTCILGVMLLVGCGDKKPVNQIQQTQSKNNKAIKTQDEINDDIKNKSVKGDFIKINAGEMKGESVYLVGEVISIYKENIPPTFLLKTKEGNGYGLYSIKVIDKNLLNKLKEGLKVKVYGKVLEKNDCGMPTVSGNIIKNE